MFKKTAALLAILLFLSMGAYADIFLVEPAERTLQNNDVIEFGGIAMGETLSVVVQRKSGFDFQWDSLIADEAALPPGWAAESSATDKALAATITIPRDAEESIQKISFILESSSQPFSKEKFSAFVTVKENLLMASMESLKQDAMVGKEAVFRIVLNNESIAPQKVLVESSLPNYWFVPMEIELKPLETVDLNLSISPQSYGSRNFTFTVSSQLNDFRQGFQSELNVFSTLKGKFSSPIFGFPFFVVSLLPQFIINAFLAFLS